MPSHLQKVDHNCQISWGDVTKHKRGGLSLYVATMRPTSTGAVRLHTSNPFEMPEIDPGYFSTLEDRQTMRKGMRFALQLKEQLRIQGYDIKDAHIPCSDEDADLDNFMNDECQSANHYSSTCRMAPEAEGGVVDASLKVYGFHNLRIIDSSIFPETLSTHLAATTIAIAEKGAVMIIQDRG